MALNIKKIQDIMRKDAGVNGDAQRMEQIVWVLFLKVYDLYEKKWKTEANLLDKKYTSIIPNELAWDNWAKSYEIEGGTKFFIQTKTGDELLEFINNKLFPTLKNINYLNGEAPLHQRIVKKAFEDTNNYMKNGTLLREVIDIIDELEFKNKDDMANLSLTYETFLKTLQSAGNAGEFYTPRAVTEFVIDMLKPQIKDKIADLACGTGGFLISAYHYLESNNKLSAADRDILNNSFYGCEKKSLPYILCATGFLINGIENPNLDHNNAFNTAFEDLCSKEQFNIIAMNPPYGGSEGSEIKNLFPSKFKANETADLFMVLITQRLKENGRAAVVLPDGFLFGNDNIKKNIKKLLLYEFNLHLIVRLPKSVFAPYTGITTNILFFDKCKNGTQNTYFYRLDMPEGIKSFGKTKSIKLEHFKPFYEWYDNGKNDIIDKKNNFKAKSFSKDELIQREYNFDLCGFINEEEEEILKPYELIEQIKKERDTLNNTLDSIMDKINNIVNENS
ncbi:SAM-dependent DNA methyltransferase [Campylobacter sp. LR185c]|uniref:class I SAM-dependent DNA methyltransferase n=1 Tax=Campylobacter sp. LR185c TaxID=2014525 RepID=UPI0012380AF6|nr:class I SAM-dependent DNA methyltransferase [Campylobacter sp. LR185c]KAA6226648.1 SAM-dependent DNA methyltransferase [Campylobacter sp. LR185c]KAA8603227.1 SAM-dependent methyltransferase [Campylobacter sp. LR185c]